MKVVNSKKLGTHTDNRYRLCLFCLKKNVDFREIQGELQKKIIEKATNVVEYNANNHYLPKVICASCRRNLYRKPISTFINFKEFKKFGPVGLSTRSSDKSTCLCYLCKCVRESTFPLFVKNNNPVRKAKSMQRGLTENRCSYCLTVIRRGKSHKCNFISYLYNVKDQVRSNFSRKQKDHLIADLLKETVAERMSTTGFPYKNQEISLSQTKGGKNLRVKITPLPEKQIGQMQLNDVIKMKYNNNLSGRSIAQIISATRKATGYNAIVEPNIKKKLMDRSHVLDDYFEAKEFNFVHVKGDEEIISPAPAVICSNVRGLIEYVKSSRKIVNEHLKIGIDGGGDFLKICLSIQSPNNSTSDELLQAEISEDSKDTGVKKVILLCIAPKVQENYKNVSMLWSALNIDDLDYTIATDLKLANILTGLQNHASEHPCIYCDAKKSEFYSCGNIRTIKSCHEDYKHWCLDGCDRKKAKNFNNCINIPIFKNKDGNLISDTLIMDIIPPPELHMMLGSVDTIFKKMMIEFPEESAQWAKMCNVERKIICGQPAFEGNACKKILNNVDKLRSICSLGCLKFVSAFDSLKKVVNSCFGMKLDAQFCYYIDEFKNNFERLDIPVTTKLHIIFTHLKQFCLKYNRALGYFSEQVIESVHHDFNVTWSRFKVPKIHPNFTKNLLRAVCVYNTEHI